MNKGTWFVDLDILSYWHVGSGRGGGLAVDARMDRDSEDLPYVPGKMLKGLFRDACSRLETWGNPDYGFVQELFGSTGTSDGNQLLDRNRSFQGSFSITDARIPEALRMAIIKDETSCAQRKAAMFTYLHTTAIDKDTGVALEGSLHAIEVAVPMRLSAIMVCPKYAQQVMEAASALVIHIGAHRTRGLGEVKICFREVS